MPPAARLGDNVIHDGPHCHAPIHPPGPTPTPLPHPPAPIAIVKGAATVQIGKMPAARVSDMTAVCLAPCVPSPGMIAKGSATVMIENLPAARMGDMVAFQACVGPIPMPTGKIIKGEPTVQIGG
jgi:uncharacterized Zn-binding protein involved in type VI secretion